MRRIKLSAAAEAKVSSQAKQVTTTSNQNPSIEDYVRFTIKAYEEAYAEAEDLEMRDRQYVAQMAWRCVLPIMDSVASAKAFIACVAVGHARGWLSPEDARALAYTAQLALAAMKGGKH